MLLGMPPFHLFLASFIAPNFPLSFFTLLLGISAICIQSFSSSLRGRKKNPKCWIITFYQQYISSWRKKVPKLIWLPPGPPVFSLPLPATWCKVQGFRLCLDRFGFWFSGLGRGISIHLFTWLYANLGYFFLGACPPFCLHVCASNGL